jgi:hypothetical protein
MIFIETSHDTQNRNTHANSKKCCSDDLQFANLFIFIFRVLDDIIRVMKYHVSYIQTSIKERAKTYRLVLGLGRSHQKNGSYRLVLGLFTGWYVNDHPLKQDGL